MKKLIYIGVVLLATAFIGQVKAQEGYVPPPLFGEPNLPPPKDPVVQQKVPKIPPVSRPVDNVVDPKLEDENLIQKRVIKTAPKEEAAKPVIKKSAPVKKLPPIEETLQESVAPPAPTPDKKPAIKPASKKIDVKPGTEPIDLLIQEKEPALPEAQPKKNLIEPIEIKRPEPSKGVVKGPKTMPAVKKHGVEAEVIFEPEDTKAPKMIERIEKEAPEIKPLTLERPPKPVIMPASALPEIELLDDGRQKIVMTYQSGTVELGDTNKAIIDQLIIPAMDLNRERQLQIQAFASAPYDEMNADRRLSLSRAMKIREYLLKQAISATRIDVRSMGAQTDIQPFDRVEFYIVE